MKNQSFLKQLNKGIATPLAIVIILVCAALVGGIAVWQYRGIKESKTPEITPPEEVSRTEEDEIANWKTFRSEEYGFELKYPENIEVKEEGTKVEFMSKERGIFRDGFIGYTHDITRRDWPQLRFECEALIREGRDPAEVTPPLSCSAATDTPILYFSVEHVSQQPATLIQKIAYEGEEVTKETSRELLANKEITLQSEPYYINHSLENEGNEFFIYASNNGSLLIYHPITNCLRSLGAEGLTFLSQCDLFNQVISTFRLLD